MEDKRLGGRGTVGVGALAIIAVFMIAVTCLTALIAEYNRYVRTVKTVSQKLLMKGVEKLAVEQISNTKNRVRNEGAQRDSSEGFSPPAWRTTALSTLGSTRL